MYVHTYMHMHAHIQLCWFWRLYFNLALPWRDQPRWKSTTGPRLPHENETPRSDIWARTLIQNPTNKLITKSEDRSGSNSDILLTGEVVSAEWKGDNPAVPSHPCTLESAGKVAYETIQNRFPDSREERRRNCCSLWGSTRLELTHPSGVS